MDEPLEQEDRTAYVDAMAALNSRGVRYMLGGAFAVCHFTSWWRHTHDMDVYVVESDVQEACRALEEAGFRDLGEQAEGDRDWIYHAGRSKIIVDVIWRFANLIEYITPDWFERASRGRFLGVETGFLPLEELIWIKVFVMNRHRCDWPDVFRIIKAQCRSVDWDRLLAMLGEHWLLLAGAIDVFDWLHTDSYSCIPDPIREELLARRRLGPPSGASQDRERLLDPWVDQRTDGYVTWRDESSDG